MKSTWKNIDIDQLGAVAREILDIVCKNKVVGSAIMIGMDGEIGAGKTSFVQVLAKELGINQMVQSPTFVLQKKYKIKRNEFQNLIHIDAYRITDESEAGVLGIEKLAKDGKNIIMIEWFRNIESLLSEEYFILTIMETGEKTRNITLTSVGE